MPIEFDWEEALGIDFPEIPSFSGALFDFALDLGPMRASFKRIARTYKRIHKVLDVREGGGGGGGSGVGLGRAVAYGTYAMLRYAQALTHVDTGALRGAHRVRFEQGGKIGVIYIDPNAQNPQTGRKAAMYGPIEHQRGGSHAFYSTTVETYGRQVLGEMAAIVKRDLEDATRG